MALSSTLNPLVVVKMSMAFSIMNGTIGLFDSGCQDFTIGNQFSQVFGDLFDIPDATTDMEISLEAITNASMIYFMSNSAIQIKLVPQGGSAGATPPLTLLPGLPSLVSLQNIVGVYVSNTTGQATKALIFGVGITGP